MRDESKMDRVREDATEGAALDIHGTPRIYVNGKLYRSGTSAEQMARAIELALGANAQVASEAAIEMREQRDPIVPIPADVPAMAEIKYGPLHFMMDTFESGIDDKGMATTGKHQIPEGWNPQTPITNFGVLFVSDCGWVHVERFGLLNCYPKHLLDTNYTKGHSVIQNHRDWLDCIRTRRRPRADVEIGASSTILAHLGCIALWTGRALQWDPLKEEFINDRQANALRSRASRAPWSV